MAYYHPQESTFKLVPFFQNRIDCVGFMIKIDDKSETILNMVVQKEDYNTPHVFFDILSTAIETLLNYPILVK